jgi:flagellar M-ring protein FliF
MAETMDNSSGIAGMWSRLGAGGRVGLVVGALVVGIMIVAGAIWSMQPDYRVLFSNLAETDAAAIVTELKRTKTVYRLSDGGTTIRVPADRVYETRLALMSSSVPLSGGVGFEIFDKQGLGATEQSQRVSYQRALQGELARTIGALDHVRQARVLLALPTSSLFQRDRQQPRAAVSLIMQPGPPLEREQVAGIQRLVAASIADLDPAHVVVTDQRGVTLSDPDTLTGPGGVGGGRLAMKREIEEYFTRKIADLLESAYGPGQVIVSVDVALNFDEIHRTVQSLLPASSSAPADAGVHRKRQVITGGAPTDEAANPGENDSNARRPMSSSTDVEYEYGRRVEQVVSSPGNIEQMSVGVVVRGQLSDEKQARIAQLVRMAAGLNERRGDAVTVQLLDATETRAARGAQPPEPAAAAIGAEPIPPPVKPTASVAPSLALLAGAAGLIAGLLLVLLGTRPRKSAPARPLTAAERADLLNELQQTFATPATAGATSERPS